MTKRFHTTIRIPAQRERSVLQMSGATLTVGTRVLTASGERLVEDLKPGDQVISKDFGAQPVRYTVFQDVDLKKTPELAPISLNYPGVPHAYFAPNQQIALRHPMFDMLFGGPEILVTSSDLLDMPGVSQNTGLTSITYVALGFGRRHLITCNGITVDQGPNCEDAPRICISGEEAQLAWRLMSPSTPEPKRHGFPLH